MADLNRIISAGSLEAASRSARSPSSSALNCRWRANSNACSITLACSSGGRSSISSMSLAAVIVPTLAAERPNFKWQVGVHRGGGFVQRHGDGYRSARGLPLPRAGQREGAVSAVQGGGNVWGVDGVGEGGDGVRNSKLQHPTPKPGRGPRRPIAAREPF